MAADIFVAQCLLLKQWRRSLITARPDGVFYFPSARFSSHLLSGLSGSFVWAGSFSGHKLRGMMISGPHFSGCTEGFCSIQQLVTPSEKILTARKHHEVRAQENIESILLFRFCQRVSDKSSDGKYKYEGWVLVLKYHNIYRLLGPIVGIVLTYQCQWYFCQIVD